MRDSEDADVPEERCRGEKTVCLAFDCGESISQGQIWKGTSAVVESP